MPGSAHMMPMNVVQQYVQCEIEVSESITLESTNGAIGAIRTSSAIWLPCSVNKASSLRHLCVCLPSSRMNVGRHADRVRPNPMYAPSVCVTLMIVRPPNNPKMATPTTIMGAACECRCRSL